MKGGILFEPYALEIIGRFGNTLSMLEGTAALVDISVAIEILRDCAGRVIAKGDYCGITRTVLNVAADLILDLLAYTDIAQTVD